MASWGEILRSRLFRRSVAVALLAVAVAACIGDSTTCAKGAAAGRCAAKARAGANASEITGSASARAGSAPRQAARAIPPVPRKPQTVAAGPTRPAGEPAASARRPDHSRLDITGLIKRTGPRAATFAGLTVVVGRGETVDTLARRYGVPASAIRQANQIPDSGAVWSGQRLVIPRGA